MNRAQLIIGMIIVSALLVPSMSCWIPGVVLTPAEAECCLKMLSTCGDLQMEHSCCKPSKPSGEFGLTAQAKPQPPIILAAVIKTFPGFRPEVQKPGAGFGFSHVVREHPPSIPSIDILRI